MAQKYIPVAFPRRRYGVWTDVTRPLAHEMCKAGHSNSEIGAATGMSTSAVQRELRGSPGHKDKTPHHRSTELAKCPPAVFEERARRLDALHARSFTGALFGDPAPGFSALDRRRARA